MAQFYGCDCYCHTQTAVLQNKCESCGHVGFGT